MPDQRSFLGSLAITLCFLAGCESTEPYAKYDANVAFPVTAERKTAYLDVAPMATVAPAARDQTRLSEFLAAYHRQGEAPISVTITGRSGVDPIVRREAGNVAYWLQKQGIPAQDIRLYVAESPVAAGPQLTFPIYVTPERRCGNYTDSIENDHDSANTENFGCATQKNIEAMAANPRDLAQMSTPTGRDGTRAWVVVNNYQYGKPIPGANDIKQDANYTIGPISSGSGGQ